jgi:hypothetical protein
MRELIAILCLVGWVCGAAEIVPERYGYGLAITAFLLLLASVQ